MSQKKYFDIRKTSVKLFNINLRFPSSVLAASLHRIVDVDTRIDLMWQRRWFCTHNFSSHSTISSKEVKRYWKLDIFWMNLTGITQKFQKFDRNIRSISIFQVMKLWIFLKHLTFTYVIVVSPEVEHMRRWTGNLGG